MLLRKQRLCGSSRLVSISAPHIPVIGGSFKKKKSPVWGPTSRDSDVMGSEVIQFQGLSISID